MIGRGTTTTGNRPLGHGSDTAHSPTSDLRHRRIVTICSSLNRLFFMAPPRPEDAMLSSVSWSEKRQAGQLSLS